MKSQTSLAARNCRLQEWSKMVHYCNNRPIGKGITCQTPAKKYKKSACPRQKSINFIKVL